ncbi:hypothetical protein HYH03_003349 [Edaphochlamys debaryana]|uniref:Uncharacterized protein n=1 Tax=Edaphochlamys debaryana TaxID=47281 RepID=A0A836C474_9CHLO|nr:hypothetical protein HYH03_003349 [Edaphochlamys debaryana]|eukprot:KAG2498598.1 hypothetical protein HYH03_003349 [Edaphochlamys debaryana]
MPDQAETKARAPQAAALTQGMVASVKRVVEESTPAPSVAMVFGPVGTGPLSAAPVGDPTVDPPVVTPADGGGGGGADSATLAGAPKGDATKLAIVPVVAKASIVENEWPHVAHGRPAAAGAELAALIPRAFPGDGLSAQGLPEAAVRRAIAAWLASSPQPLLGKRTALLPQLGQHLRQDPTGLWLNAKYTWPKIKTFLLAEDSLGVFVVEGQVAGREWVRLDVEALQAAATVTVRMDGPALRGAAGAWGKAAHPEAAKAPPLSRAAAAEGAAASQQAKADLPQAAEAEVAAAVKAAAAAVSGLATSPSADAATAPEEQRRPLTPAPIAAATARLPPPHEQLETLLLNRFPPFELEAAQRLASAAKRAAAKLLALALPSRTLSLRHLEEAVPVLMGSAQPPSGLRELCDEEPDVFHVWLQPPSTWMVGLVWSEAEALVGTLQAAVCPGSSSFDASRGSAGCASASTSTADAPRGSAGGSFGDCRSFEAGLKNLWTALHARFPTPGPAPELQPERLRNAAKRYVARGLATVPGHVRNLEGFLATMHAHLLEGGSGPPLQRLRALCEEEPDVFAVWLQAPGVWMVRLVCAELAALGGVPANMGLQARPGPAAAAAAREGLGDAASGQDVLDNGAEEEHAPRAEPAPTPASEATAEPLAVPPSQPAEELGAALNPPTEDGCAASTAVSVLPPARPRVPGPELLPPAPVRIVSDPFTPALAAMLQHCRTCTHLGLAVHSYGGAPAVVCVYTPPVAWARVPGAAAAAACDQPGAGAAGGAAAVYVVDLTAAEGLHSGGRAGADAARLLLFSVRGLMEDPALCKMVHGREQVRVLEAAWGGAAITPLLDSRLLLKGLTAMLDIHPPPSQPASESGTSPSSAEAASKCLAQATAHVSALRSGLAAAGLWADRPDLLAALSAVHFAALRDELQGGEGGGIAWGCRPLSASQVGAAAASARHLPELWAALWEASYLASAGKVGTRRSG